MPFRIDDQAQSHRLVDPFLSRCGKRTRILGPQCGAQHQDQLPQRYRHRCHRWIEEIEPSIQHQLGRHLGAQKAPIQCEPGLHVAWVEELVFALGSTAVWPRLLWWQDEWACFRACCTCRTSGNDEGLRWWDLNALSTHAWTQTTLFRWFMMINKMLTYNLGSCPRLQGCLFQPSN